MKFFSKRRIILGVLAVTLGAGIFFLVRNQGAEIRVAEDEYRVGDKMKVYITNSFLTKKLCLSSCYPYFLQKKDGSWEEYRYEDCSYRDRITKCIKPFQRKAFRTSIQEVTAGMYRLSVPVCNDCNLGTVFQEEQRLYSDDFKIK